MRRAPMILLLVAALGSPVIAQLAPDAAIAKAEAILKNLQDGKTADIVKEFDARIAQDLPEARLKPAWQGLVFRPLSGAVLPAPK